jgi:ferredoxin-NADP reductase
MVTAPPVTFDVAVTAVRERTPRVRSFELRRPDGEALPEFSAGAHLDIHLPNGLIRSYSLVNDARERDRYEIAVLREPDGTGGSLWLHDQVRSGDRLAVTAPANRFELDEGGDEHILIAGGIGVTPLFAMAHRLDELGLPFRFYYCARNADDAAYASELAAAFGERVRMHYSGGDAASRLDVTELLRVRAPGSHVYVCGPRGLIDATRAAARDWPRGTVHFELFGAARAEATGAANRAFDVHLRRRNLTVHVAADQSILDALAGQNIRLTAVCRDGFCGTCTTRYVAGAVDHRDGVLDEEERRSVLQVCVSRAIPGDTLVLDL